MTLTTNESKELLKKIKTQIIEIDEIMKLNDELSEKEKNNLPGDQVSKNKHKDADHETGHSRKKRR